MEIRPARASDMEAFERVRAVAFGRPWDQARGPAGADRYEPDRTLAGFDGERLVATGTAHSFRISVPGPG
ncbi:MAG: GNAT family N-acetyltransferase, partial [Acidimicrobiales bacterium]